MQFSQPKHIINIQSVELRSGIRMLNSFDNNYWVAAEAVKLT